MMRDTLQIGTSSSGGFGDNVNAVTWTYDTENLIKCTVKDGVSKEVKNGAETTITTSEIRVPSGTAITNVKRVKVTKRHRVTLGTAEIYAVIGDPDNAAGSLVLNCNKVSGNSMT
jgi:head-tail adaptor